MKEKKENSKVLYIRDVPQAIIDKLDNIVKEKGFESRNQLTLEIITKYAEYEDAIYYQSLPPIVKEICAQTITDYKKDISAANEIATKNISLAALQLLNVTQWFEEYIMLDTAPQTQNELHSLIEEIEKKYTDNQS